jgi:hypothetical protein
MRYLNEFNAGVRARCEQAGLTPAETQVVGAAVDEIYRSPGRKSAGLKTELQNLGYNIRKRFPGAVDRAYDVALRLPAPVWFGGASALASVPFSLVGGLRRRGQQQEDGKTDEKPAPFHFMRNALLAGSAGAAVPLLLHRTTPFVRFSHDRELRRGYPKAVEVVKDNWKSLLEQKQKLPPGAPGTDARQAYLDHLSRMDEFADNYVLPLEFMRDTYGNPAKRWRHLFKPLPEDNMAAGIAGLPPPIFNLYMNDRSQEIQRQQGIADPRRTQ